MGSKIPTLFDGFFLEDEPSQNDKPIKKVPKKKKEVESFSLFDVTEDSDNDNLNDTEIDNHIDETPTEPKELSEIPEDPLKSEDSEDIESLTDASEKEYTHDEVEHVEALESDSSELEEETFEENCAQDDMRVLDNQYFEELDYFNRPEDFFIQNNHKEEISIESNTEEISEETTEVDTLESFVPEDWNLTKHYYSIGEVAKMFNVNISHIRFWSNEFKLQPRTNKKGNRFYTPTQIETIQLIHYLVKEKKHTIKGAQEKLKSHKKLVKNNMVLKDSLLDLKSKLEELKNQF